MAQRKVYHFHSVYFHSKPEEFSLSCAGISPLNPEATEDEVRALAAKAVKIDLEGELKENAEVEATEPYARGLLVLAERGDMTIVFPKGFEVIKAYDSDEELEYAVTMNNMMGGGTIITEEQIAQAELKLLGEGALPVVTLSENRQLIA